MEAKTLKVSSAEKFIIKIVNNRKYSKHLQEVFEELGNDKKFDDDEKNKHMMILLVSFRVLIRKLAELGL